MVKLLALPEMDIISGFRGKVDFYIYHPSCDPQNKTPGIPCARKWPRSPGHKRAPAVESTWAAFSYASSHWNELPEEVRNAYAAMAQATGLSPRDMFTRSYLSGLYRYELSDEVEMQIHILDVEVQKASHAGIAASIPWTDVDLTAEVPTNATHAIMRCKLQCNGPAVVNDYGMTLRQKGGNQGVDVVHWWAGVTTAFCVCGDSVVPMDANKKIQYKVDIPVGGGNVFVTLWCLGYYYQ